MKKKQKDLNKNTSDDEDNDSGSDIEVDIKKIPLKITMVGNSSVGKTSIIKRYFENKFEINSTEPTISAFYHCKNIKIDPFTEAELQIWDTAGQEKYRSLTKNYLLNANGILIVFDLGDEKSFNALDSWIEEINNAIDEKKVTIILVGNKSDLPEQKINKDDALAYAKKHNMKYLNVSAKDGINIEYLFEIMGSDCIKKIQDEQNNNEKDDLPKKENRDSTLSGQFENNINLEDNRKNEQTDQKSKKCC